MKNYDNESGVAYVWFMILALLILGGLVWMGIAMGLNMFMITVNERIDAGMMSTQTADPIAFGMGLFSAIPIILIVLVLIWAVMASVNRV